MFQKFLILILNLNYILCNEAIVDVRTLSGIVRGQTIQVLKQPINQFLGIPFAEPPVGRLRFAKPEPIKSPLKGIIEAIKPKNSCLQNDKSISGLLTESEDCLTLNIWSPQLNHKNASALKPVMFWIYGGGLRSGSIYLPTYNGSILATHDVVIVSTNYRLGPFGWLYGGQDSAPGNVGLYDQQLALKWVKQNIRSFGGDPDMITIFGESAGSFSVSAHILSPLSRGLFKRAILESGAVFDDKNTGLLTKEFALKQSKQMAKYFNCSEDNDKWLDCLRRVDSKLLTKHYSLHTYPIEGTDILPLKAQNAFKSHNYSTDIDIIAGVMQNEGSLLATLSYPKVKDMKTVKDFSDLVESVFIPELNVKNITHFYTSNIDTNSSSALQKAFYDFYGDIHMNCPTYLFAKQLAQNSPKSNVYFYEWTYVSKLLAQIMGCTKSMGVCHASDIEYVFGLSVLMNTKDKDFSEYVMKMWTNFAKNGNPDIDSTSKWPRIIAQGVKNAVPKVKEINPLKPNHIIDNLFEKTCEGFWKQYFI